MGHSLRRAGWFPASGAAKYSHLISDSQFCYLECPFFRDNFPAGKWVGGRRPIRRKPELCPKNGICHMNRSTLNAMPMRTGVLINLTAVTVTTASILATGCSGTGSPSTAVQPEATVTAGLPHGTSAAAAPVPARLTMAQARAEYSEISAPFNAAVTVVNHDARAGVTWSKFKADVLAVVAANKTWERKIRAVRWPLRVQPYVDAMLKTEVPAEIQCDQAMAATGSLQGAANVFSDDHSCKDSTANADKIREILNLPPTIS